MINKLLSIVFGAVLWGLGLTIDVAVAIGKYGLPAFLAGVLLALGLLISKAFLDKKASLDLWVIILRGLAVEALLFPAANLIMVFMLTKGFPFEITRAVLIESGLIAVILAGVFFFNAHLLNKKVRRRQMGSEKD
ncbi:hypothetical protein Desaci_1747 [Desulfosporosinus acidiphilus SJ4]|uniref:Uncharacterized protein n=1 Tax=Desulfosporosinus acidiphilus (strain DSM 22704 / JCM 16185 / SJ4) TaxID=646529 RepID=I4D4L1_DESAJ|nr:hypothetical protein [Desulfosporosinus acidiphilus]AFM40735.1 hypothetical protein Desaci_1747 [Desulfosporosinus acidiphilus SJ4]